VPDFLPTRILLAQLYFKTDRKQDAERERSEIQRLTEAQQKFSEELLKRDQAKPSASGPTNSTVQSTTADTPTKKP